MPNRFITYLAVGNIIWHKLILELAVYFTPAYLLYRKHNLIYDQMHFVKTHEIEFDTFPYLCQMMSQSPSQLSGFGASNFYTQGISPTSTDIYIVYKIITISVYQICVFTIQGK